MFLEARSTFSCLWRSEYLWAMRAFLPSKQLHLNFADHNQWTRMFFAKLAPSMKGSFNQKLHMHLHQALVPQAPSLATHQAYWFTLIRKHTVHEAQRSKHGHRREVGLHCPCSMVTEQNEDCRQSFGERESGVSGPGQHIVRWGHPAEAISSGAS